MKNTTIYLDESGDLGWVLDKPHNQGGSSRYMTLAAVIVPTHKTHFIARVVRNLYKARNRPKSNELKSVELRPHERATFARELVAIRQNHPDISFVAITVAKANVNAAFRKHPNGLYNYMTKLMLLDEMGKHDHVDFIPDARSVKVELKHAFHDYLRTALAEHGFNTQLLTTPQTSREHFEIQFADILAGLVWSHIEYDNQQVLALEGHIAYRRLFFGT